MQLDEILEEMDDCIRETKEKFKGREDNKALRLYVSVMNLAKTIVIKHMTAKDKNVPTNNGWIPVEEGLPDEHKSVFARYKNTFRWDNAMFETCSNNVNVTIEDTKGNKTTAQAYTADGEWRCDIPGYNKWYRIVAWKPLPEPYCREKGKVTYSSMQDTPWPEWREKVMGEFLKRE